MTANRPQESFDQADRDELAAGQVTAAIAAAHKLPYDNSKDRERIRGWVALALVGLFAAMIAFLVFAVTWKWLDPQALEKIAAILLAPVSGLLGAVVGFYYGEQSHRRGP